MSKKRSKFVDAHCHLTNSSYLLEHIDMIIEQAISNNIEFLVVNGGHEKENLQILKLIERYKQLNILIPAIGIHPEDGKDENDYLRVEPLINDSIKAIGEIGLDYYYEDGPSRENQIKSMEGQLKLAQKFNLPVVIHIRDKEDCDQAYQDVYDLMKKYKVKFMLHTYSGTVEWAEKFKELDAYFSFSGTVTFASNQNARNIIKIVPLNRILVETDSPYLRPHPYVDEKNEPNKVLFVSYYIGGLLEMGMDKFVSIVNKNLRELFNIK